ncbi:PAS domain-containing sensor histidine kinase [Agaribacter flavus]|uniref:histidine kinase n=1 Tax=Agaribacter flavus TaxID=1902781 RepID=A0ABV7FM88_9ALTE
MQFDDALQILDLVESGVIMLDSKQRIVFWNRFVSDTSLIDFQNIENKPWLDVFPSLDNTRIQKAVDKAVNLNFPSILSYKLLKATFPLFKKSLATRPPYHIVQSVVIKPLMEGSKNKGCIIYINDVSAASKREEELNRQSVELDNTLQRYTQVKSQLEEIFDRTHNGIIVFDDSGKIIKVNSAASDFFNFKYANLVDKDIAELLPSLKERYYDSERQLYCYQSTDNHEFDQHILSPTEKYFSVSISQIGEDIDGHFFIFISDITERKQAEKKLLNANIELEEFAYRTSHDLRSPIVSSLGLIRIAKNSIDAGNNGKALECLGHIENSLSKLEILIQDILKLTEMENAEENEQRLDVQMTIKQVFESMCQLEGFDRVEKQLDINTVKHVIVKQSRFRMILENLISNAIKYHDPKVENAYINIRAKVDSEHVIIDVSDNGLGIPKEQQHKLFEMFNRFHPKIAFGSGLGLYLIKKSAHVLGGDVEYIQQTKGACFRLTIPQSTGDE